MESLRSVSRTWTCIIAATSGPFGSMSSKLSSVLISVERPPRYGFRRCDRLSCVEVVSSGASTAKILLDNVVANGSDSMNTRWKAFVADAEHFNDSRVRPRAYDRRDNGQYWTAQSLAGHAMQCRTSLLPPVSSAENVKRPGGLMSSLGVCRASGAGKTTRVPQTPRAGPASQERVRPFFVLLPSPDFDGSAGISGAPKPVSFERSAAELAVRACRSKALPVGLLGQVEAKVDAVIRRALRRPPALA